MKLIHGLAILTFATSSSFAATATFRVVDGIAGDKEVGADVVSDITWADRLGLPRTVSLVTSSSKFHEGWLSRYVYDGITVNAVDSGSGGLTDVSHGGGMLKGRGRKEWSSRNHRLSRVFKGDHHGLVRIEYDMPFSLGENQGVSKELIHVTRDLFFASGTDHLVYAITLDFSKVPKNRASVDTRSPYMRWDWDGTGNGMGPYDGYRCGTDGTLVCENTRTGTAKTVKTLGDNLIPFVYQWNTGSNRCAAIIGTRPYAELPQGSECWADNPDPIIPAGTYTRDTVEAWKLPYQVGGYSGWIEKLTWQVPYNLGHEKVKVGKYEYTAWPRYSYSVLVLLDRLDRGSFERLLGEQERMGTVKSSARVGKVMMQAPPGVGREKESSRLVTPGYDPILRAWRFTCAKNKADVALDTGTGTLVNPVLILDDYRKPVAPEIPDALVSLDAEARRLYVTLTRSLTGATRIVF